MTPHLSDIRLDRAGTWRGFRRMAPISIFVIAFGLAFGVAAAQRGLSGLEITLMSALVFAGASQFAALEMWGPELPLAALIASTFAINARHLLMGASLYPWLRELPATQRYTTLSVLSDANWAMAANDYQRGQRNAGILLGGGLALWLAWMIGSLLGVAFGSGISDPQRFGLDVIMGCFLLSMVAGGDNDSLLLPWSAAAMSALLALWWLPPHSHVIVGALVGGVVGVLNMPRKQCEETAS